MTRQIYHCPYCNLCRVGKGLGIDYFHCMNCNACMSRSLTEHVCREKCFEDNCPICHEYIFTSTSPVKALPCGHLMHSACFQVFTRIPDSFQFASRYCILLITDDFLFCFFPRTTLVPITSVQSVASRLGTCRYIQTCLYIHNF